VVGSIGSLKVTVTLVVGLTPPEPGAGVKAPMVGGVRSGAGADVVEDVEVVEVVVDDGVVVDEIVDVEVDDGTGAVAVTDDVVAVAELEVVVDNEVVVDDDSAGPVVDRGGQPDAAAAGEDATEAAPASTNTDSTGSRCRRPTRRITPPVSMNPTATMTIAGPPPVAGRMQSSNTRCSNLDGHHSSAPVTRRRTVITT
jgi:hypothetical protein